MEKQEIRQLVSGEVANWLAKEGTTFSTEPRVTEGAIEALTLIVANIADDPSPTWIRPSEGEFNDDHLFHASQLVPDLLTEVARGYENIIPSRPEDAIVLSSWEIWHRLSSILDVLCFIPKRER